MQFINKFKYKRKGHRIIKAFIKDKWNNDIQRYVNLNYNELKRIKAFKYLLQRTTRILLLLHEKNSF